MPSLGMEHEKFVKGYPPIHQQDRQVDSGKTPKRRESSFICPGGGKEIEIEDLGTTGIFARGLQ